jgi:hypothetical protein
MTHRKSEPPTWIHLSYPDTDLLEVVIEIRKEERGSSPPSFVNTFWPSEDPGS